jgi:hypothetical protein
MDRGQYTGQGFFPSMIVNNFDLFSASIGPNETDTPLIIEADRVLPFTVSLQSFQPVTGRRVKII